MRDITVFVILQQHMKYTLSRTKLKENHYETFLFIISLLYMFIRSCKFVVIGTRAYDIAHDKNTMGSLISESI